MRPCICPNTKNCGFYCVSIKHYFFSWRQKSNATVPACSVTLEGLRLQPRPSVRPGSDSSVTGGGPPLSAQSPAGCPHLCPQGPLPPVTAIGVSLSLDGHRYNSALTTVSAVSLGPVPVCPPNTYMVTPAPGRSCPGRDFSSSAGVKSLTKQRGLQGVLGAIRVPSDNQIRCLSPQHPLPLPSSRTLSVVLLRVRVF